MFGYRNMIVPLFVVAVAGGALCAGVATGPSQQAERTAATIQHYSQTMPQNHGDMSGAMTGNRSGQLSTAGPVGANYNRPASLTEIGAKSPNMDPLAAHYMLQKAQQSAKAGNLGDDTGHG